VPIADEVSVVVPSFDRVELVQRALRSVLAQSVSPGEIVVVDDGSRDGTAEVVRESFPQVRLVRQRHAGVSAARNRGIAEARGRWLAFLDSDDEWRPRKLERQLAALASRPDLFVCHSDEIWIRDGRRVNPGRRHRKKGGFIFAECLPLCAMSPSSVLLERRVLERVGLFDESLPACEDYDLWLRVCSVFEVLLVDEQLVVKYGGHDDQLSRRFAGMDRFRIRALEKVLGGGELTGDNWAAARRTALEKLGIYLGGVRRRGRGEEARELEVLRRRLQDLEPPS
jgi:glycosyltransferase involved in cell wall biosynthesis